ncbi:MAG: CapA family protein [Defluviitaleaceae bacterium]|nr:CapA family protein [Defluviitaleaceae bacterium]
MSGSVACTAFSADKNRVVWQKGDTDKKHDGGLGFPIFVYYLLDLIRKGKLSWLDKVTVTQRAADQSNQPGALGLTVHEKVPLLTLFKVALINNSPDAIVALSSHVKKINNSKNSTVNALSKIGEGWGIPSGAIKNITGRFYEENPQYFTQDMLLKVAVQLLSFDLNNMLIQKNVQCKDKYYETDSILETTPITRYLSYSTGEYINTICLCDYGDEVIYFVVCGAKTHLERDHLLMEAIFRVRVKVSEPHSKFLFFDGDGVTLFGDTYCGERYTKWRIVRGIDDPIQRYGDAGYAYSFEKVAPLMSRNSFNIVNSECVLSPVYDQTQQTGKYIDFVLGAHPEKTIACYKQVNINAVMLANNHAMDFGAVGCRQTRRYFEEAGLNPIGIGNNIDEAEKPLLLEFTQSGRKVIIFNAYCYFAEKRHKLFKHYCLGANTGAAFGTNLLENLSLWQTICAYRKKYPDAFIIFSPHWSTDFNTEHLHLRHIVSKAVNAGADIIIGHGPHIPIGAEHVNGKLCIYSIGNFVFNTTGIDLDASGQSPYGIAAQILFTGKKPELRLYPIYAHNLNTFFRPYPVTTEKQYDEFSSSFMGLHKFETKKDEIGYYLSKSFPAL